MSYDLRLYRKDNFKEPLNENVVRTKLGDEFKNLNINIEDDKAIGFDVGYKPNEIDVTEFYFQRDLGCYSTYCSYGVGEDEFNEFEETVEKVAEKLDLNIYDPQTDFTPSTTMSSDSEKQQKANIFNQGKKSIEQFVDKSAWLLPTKSKHFILYFIMSNEPETGKGIFLTLSGDKLYASKVNPGESIDQVVRREIPELTGNSEYKILEVQDHDTAIDKYGNELPRYAVYIEVPYFEPNTTVLKQKVEWRPLQ